VCGFDPTDRLAVVDLERMWSKYPFWRGVGELLLRHDDLTNLTPGEPARMNHPALGPVLNFCRERGCPVSVHQDSSSPGRPQAREYVGEMAEALDRHPQTTVVWCHAGADRRLDPRGYADLVGEMIRQYPNLNFDLSWALLDKAVCPDNHPAPEWVTLICRHPDRFVLGSDITGRTDGLPARTKQCAALLDELDSTAREHVSHLNAQRLWFDE
jgi:predicted TIM-barrel fold metal-dependent hydrolase